MTRNKGPSQRHIANLSGPVSFNRPFSVPAKTFTPVSPAPAPSTSQEETLAASNIKVGDGLSLKGGKVTLNKDQTFSSLHVDGSTTFASGVDVNGASIINLGDPLDDHDCVPKCYVDEVARGLSFRYIGVVNDGDVINASDSDPGLIVGGEKDFLAKLTIVFPKDPEDGQKFKVLTSVNVEDLVCQAKFARGNAPANTLKAGIPLTYTYNSETGKWYVY